MIFKQINVVLVTRPLETDEQRGVVPKALIHVAFVLDVLCKRYETF